MQLQPSLSDVFPPRSKSPGDRSDWLSLGHIITSVARSSLSGSSARPSGMAEKPLPSDNRELKDVGTGWIKRPMPAPGVGEHVSLRKQKSLEHL